MMSRVAIFLLCFNLAIGLSLDDFPRRLGNSRQFGEFDDEDEVERGFERDFLQRTTSKRNVKLGEHEFEPHPSSFSKNTFSPEALWDMPYPPLHSFREHVKRETKKQGKTSKKDEEELANILKDDDSEKGNAAKERKVVPSTKRQSSSNKKKRESEEPVELVSLKEEKQIDHENPEFQEWLKQEYFRNMAKSFASMRRKRDMWGHIVPEVKESDHISRHLPAPSKPKKKRSDDVRFADVTDNLKSIEDALLADALKVVKENGGDYEEDRALRRRVTNDLNAAFDIETMRSALFRLRETLYTMDEEPFPIQEYDGFSKYKKRGLHSERLTASDSRRLYSSLVEQCPPLAVLTSDCAALGDTVTDDSLKDLLAHACNWHEVCYTCGEVFGLNSDNCDMGFIEQSRTVCRGDVPCESTSKLLLLPLRQRRVFYKRSNPNVCLVDPCVEEFLTHG